MKRSRFSDLTFALISSWLQRKGKQMRVPLRGPVRIEPNPSVIWINSKDD